MAEAVDDWLDSLDGSAMRDRRNGSYSRHLLTELGDIELSVPRTRRFCPSEVLRSYARRAPEIDRAILASCLGSQPARWARFVGPARPQGLGLDREPLPRPWMKPSPPSMRARLPTATRRSCSTAWCWRAKTPRPGGDPGWTARRRSSTHLATGESAAAWERFLTDLYRRGLTGNGLEMICADGGRGLIAALPTVYPGSSAAGRTKSGTCFRKADHGAVKAALHAIMNAPNRPKALMPHSPVPGKRPTPRPSPACATTSTTCSPASATGRAQACPTNAIERRFLEVRRRTRPMGTFQDRTSMDRILFAVFIHENKAQGVSTPLSLTHNS